MFAWETKNKFLWPKRKIKHWHTASHFEYFGMTNQR